MKTSRFSEAQRAGILKEVEMDAKVGEEYEALSEAAFGSWPGGSATQRATALSSERN